MINIGTLLATLRLQDKLTPALLKAQQSIKNAAPKMKAIGRKLSMGVTLPLVAAGAAVIKFATDMNKSMANVATLIPGSTERVLELKKSVQDLAIETGKSTADLADGLYNVISAFGDTADTVKILELNAKAAGAGLATTSDAIALTSAVTKGYGDTSFEAMQKASDLAFTTVKLGQTTFPELAASIGRVVPLTAELGVSQEELFGVMATATGVVGSASEVSTKLMGVMQALMAPTDKMKEVFKHLGVETAKAAIEQHGLQGVLDAVIEVSSEAGVELQKYIGSMEGQTLALSLAGAQSDNLTEKTKAMGEVIGATEEAWKEQTEGVNAAGHAWNQLKVELTVVAQKIGDELLPLFTDIVSALKDDLVPAVKEWIAWFKKLSPETKENYVQLAALVTVLPVIILMLGQIGSAVSGVIAMTSAIKAMAAGTWLATAAGKALAITILNIPIIGWVLALVSAAIAVVVWRDEIWAFLTGAAYKFLNFIDEAKHAMGLMTFEEVRLAKTSRSLAKDLGDVTPTAEELRDALGKAGMEGTVQELQQAMVNLRGVAGGLAKDEMKLIAESAMRLREEGEVLTPELKKIVGLFEQQEEAARRDAAAIDLLRQSTEEADEATKAFNNSVLELQTEWRQGGIPAMNVAMAAFEGFGDLTKLSQDQLEDLNRTLKVGIETLKRQDEAVPIKKMELYIAINQKLIKGLDTSDRSFMTIHNRLLALGAVLPIVGKALPITGFIELQGAVQNTTEEVFELSRTAEESPGIFSRSFTSIKASAQDLWKGMTDGTGKISGLFTRLGKGIMDGFGSVISGGVSTLINLGVAFAMKGLSKLGSWIKGKFGVSEAEKEGRDLVKVFEDTVAASLTQVQLAEAGGSAWKQTVIGVRDAYLAAGHSADEAMAATERLWAASKQGPEAVQAVMDSMQGVIDLGKQVQDMKNNWKGAEEAAERYGLSLDDLGPKFKARKWASEVEQLTKDWQLLNVQGAKADTIAAHMSPTVQKLISKYQQAGIEIPASLKPIIKKQIEMGLLIDKDGNKLKDMSGIKFEEPITKQFSRIADSIEKLVAALVGDGGMTDALKKVDKQKISDKSYTVTQKLKTTGSFKSIRRRSRADDNDNDDDMDGGRHGTGGRYVDFGAGTPVMLHGRERITPISEGRQEAASMSGVEQRLSSIERLLRDQPRALGLVMSDSMSLLN